MNIDYLPLKRITAMHADEIHEAVSRVIDSGWYLRGEATKEFEQHYAEYIGTKHCIGVANGLDALTLILRAYKELGVLHEGDEIIVPANTYIATILAITENRLIPVLVEPRIDTFQIDDRLIEQAVTPRTRAILIVHLYGRCAYTDKIGEIVKQQGLLLIEDNAQAHGAVANCSQRLSSLLDQSCKHVGPHCSDNSSLFTLHSSLKRTGSLGHAAAHSFYPGKNLGALGDAGAVTTNDDLLAETVRSIANYGSSRKYVFDYIGRNSRIDELQAAVLDVKLKYLDADNRERRRVAETYIRQVHNSYVRLPQLSESVYHIFPVMCSSRDRLQEYLFENGVETVVHYPIPPHHQTCYREWNNRSYPITEQIHAQELSLPCHQVLSVEEVSKIIFLLNNFSCE